MCRGVDPGKYVRSSDDDPESALCIAGRNRDRCDGADPDLWSIYRLRDRSISDLYGESASGAWIYCTFPGAAADRGKLDLPPCGRRIGWVTVDLGTGGGQHRRQPDGHCGNVDLYPHRVCGLCPVPGDCVSEAEAEEAGSGRY